MSHGEFASPLVLEPRRSRYLLIYLLFVHALALLVALLPVNLPMLLRFAIGAAVIISFVWQINRVPLQYMIWEADGDWQLYEGDGSTIIARLRPDSYVSPILVVLRFDLLVGRSRTVVILPDMLDRQSFRRLRVRLYQTRLTERADDPAM